MKSKEIESLYWDNDFKTFFYKAQKNIEFTEIHSIFDKVINIKSDKGILYTISNNTTDNAPYTLKIDYDGSFKDIINENEKILKNENEIIIGNMKINLSNVDLWDIQRKKIKKIPISEINKNIDIFNILIEEVGKNGGCKYHYLIRFLNIENNSGSLIEKELSKRIDKFYSNLKLNNIKKEDINNLIGLGMGLTPSGDDFLTGFLGTINIFDINKNLFNKIKEYISLPLTSTTDVSSAMIKAAVEDKYREYLNDFIYSFLERDENKFLKSFKNLLKIGSSSGTDMSVGVVLGFLYTIQQNEMEE